MSKFNNDETIIASLDDKYLIKTTSTLNALDLMHKTNSSRVANVDEVLALNDDTLINSNFYSSAQLKVTMLDNE